ncbi:transglycosylase SLT domain-containing protein [Mesorhizobium sp. LHD-90]|uniref:lytic transglycosylase domain-containing protein n=1 Tax=Mesorhizobium sp. LHD-90 TaxID=3071414 RepID=UPI0027DF8D0C|nr:transglycosylase SLT domain-containing protein [Mesorhizobium sp. LHD-90]MDQ6433456.1 transglycosylase SLT domain-containing protein [Mesorhizobium sp. LHD-90]
MNKTIVLTVALAAGLTTFAASAAESPTIPRTPLFSTQKAVSTEKAKPRSKAARKLASKTKAATLSKASAEKPVIVRTPLFTTRNAEARTEKTAATGKAAKAHAKATEKVGQRPKVKRKTAKLDVKTSKRSVRTAKASRGKAKSTVTTVVETTVEAKASGYPVKLDALASKAVDGSGPYHAVIARYAAEYGVPVSLAHAVISVESSYRPNATGSSGEVGLMQIMPATARGLGYSGSVSALYNPETNIRWGMKYLAGAHQLGGGTTCGTILKYNAGHGATRMNPVSRAYCGKVLRFLSN